MLAACAKKNKETYLEVVDVGEEGAQGRLGLADHAEPSRRGAALPLHAVHLRSFYGDRAG